MQKILVTGAAGFVGSNLVKKLLQEGHQVIGVDNFSYGFERNMSDFRDHNAFSFYEMDVAKDFDFSESVDAIVHLASQKIPRYTNALRTLEENNLMIKNVIKLWKKNKCKLIFSSTSDVYGKNPDLPFNEESNLVLGSTKVKRWAYATSKIYSEQNIIANCDEYNIPYTIVRFFGSYGPNQNLTWWGGPQSVFIDKALNNEEIELHGDGLQTRTFTYVEDTVRALYACIVSEEANGEIYNIGSNPEDEITIKDLASLIWELVRGKDDQPKLKLIPYENFGRYEDVRRRVPDITKIKEHLGYTPQVSLRKGLTTTIEWQKSVLVHD